MIHIIDKEHHKSIIDGLCNDEVSSDVTFAIGDDKFYAHFGLIAVAMPSILQIICKNVIDCNHDPLTIILADEKPVDLEKALNELYISGTAVQLEILMGFKSIQGEKQLENQEVSDRTEAELLQLGNDTQHSGDREPEENMMKKQLTNVDNKLSRCELDYHTNSINALQDACRKNPISQVDSDVSFTNYFSRKELLTCDLCEKAYETAYGLCLHRKRKHGDQTEFSRGKPVCPFCGKTAKYIDKHIRTFHKDKSGCLVCDVCKKPALDLKKHRSKCNKCKFCDYVNKRKDRLLKHMKISHGTVINS